MTLEIAKRSTEYWRVIIRHPPLNLLDTEMLSDLRQAVSQMEAAPELAVVVFESGLPGYFMAHQDLSGGAAADVPSVLAGWPELAQRLEHAPFISIGLLRGRARGAGNEFLLALDLRFASLEKAVLGQPEVGIGLVPGAGGLERLPGLIGRARSLEVIAGAEDYSARTAERYGWINQALPDAELDAFVERVACRLARFGRDAISRAKLLLLERAGASAAADLAEAGRRFSELHGSSRVRRRLQQLFELGLQQDGRFERDLGSLLGLQ